MSDPSRADRRWLRPSPTWLAAGSLAATAVLFLSDRYRWFAFNQHKGWSVLIAVAALLAVLAAMLLWWLAAVVFRWRSQVSIRSLLVLVVAVALPCSWLTAAIMQANAQRKGVEAIERAQGRVDYDLQASQLNATGRSRQKPRPHEAAWLRSIVGDHFFASPTGVSLLGTRVTDAGLENLSGLTELQALWLSGTPVTDVGLENLRGLTTLRRLFLDGTRITDAGLENLRGLTALHELCLNQTGVTGTGLKNVGGLSALQVLGLVYTRVNDAGLENLRGLTALQELYLNGTQVTDAGVKKLQQALPDCTIQH